MNAPVRWGFFGSPDNDNNPDNLVVTPFATGVGGTFSSIWNEPEGNGGTTLTAQLPAIRAGLAYINFHTVQFGGGEIRGQIVPEPSSIVLAGLGGLIVLCTACCRRAGSSSSTRVGYRALRECGDSGRDGLTAISTTSLVWKSCQTLGKSLASFDADRRFVW